MSLIPPSQDDPAQEYGIEEHRATASVAEPDAHGQAALLLTKSLLRPLVATATPIDAEAIEVLIVAAQVKVEVAAPSGGSRRRRDGSLHRLSKMADDFRADQRVEPKRRRLGPSPWRSG